MSSGFLRDKIALVTAPSSEWSMDRAISLSLADEGTKLSGRYPVDGIDSKLALIGFRVEKL